MFSQRSFQRFLYPQGPLALPTPRDKRVKDVSYQGTDREFLEIEPCLNRTLLRRLDNLQGHIAFLFCVTILKKRGLTSGFCRHKQGSACLREVGFQEETAGEPSRSTGCASVKGARGFGLRVITAPPSWVIAPLLRRKETYYWRVSAHHLLTTKEAASTKDKLQTCLLCLHG